MSNVMYSYHTDPGCPNRVTTIARKIVMHETDGGGVVVFGFATCNPLRTAIMQTGGSFGFNSFWHSKKGEIFSKKKGRMIALNRLDTQGISVRFNADQHPMDAIRKWVASPVSFDHVTHLTRQCFDEFVFRRVCASSPQHLQDGW